MFRNRIFKVMSNLILLVILCVSQVAARSKYEPADWSKYEPLNGLTNLPTKVRFEFSNLVLFGGGPYEFCVDSSNNNTCNTSWEPVNSGLFEKQLDPNGTYYWQIRSADGSYANNGEWWSFTTTNSVSNKPDLRITKATYTPPSLQTGASHFKV